MTTNEYINRLNAKIVKLKTGLPISIAAQDTHVKMVERIFENGKTSTGDTKEYDNKKPLYVNPDNSPQDFPTRGKPKGNKKRGETTFKNGKPHKTGYFESYKKYREQIDRDTDFVNLNLWGNLHSDFGKGVIKESNFKYVSGVSQGANEGKVEKFSEYFKLSKEERDNFKEVLEFETLKILK